MFNNIKQKIKNNIGKDIYEFLSHSKNYVTADVVSKGLAFISIPIFTRLLVPSEYGILAVFTSFVGFFSIVYGLGVRTGVTIYYFEKTDDFDEFYGSNILLIIVWGLLLSGVLYFLRNYVQRFFKIPLLLIYLGIGVTFSKSIFQLYKSYLQASKQSKKIAKLTIIRAVGIIVIGIIITLLLKDDKFYGKATAKLIMSFLFLIISLKAILSISKVKFEKKYLKYSLILGLPIVLHLISSRILKTFDQIIINQLVGPGETGLYSFAFKIGMILNIIAMGLQRAWSPMLYERLNQKKYKDIESLASKYSKIIYTVAFWLILFSREIVTVMAAKEYHSSLGVVPVVIVAYVFVYLYTMYVNFAFYHKKTYLIAVFTIIAGGVNIGLNYLLIPQFGYIAAAWTTLISYVILFLLHYCNIKYIIKPEWLTPLKVFIPNFLLLLLGIAVYFQGIEYIDNIWYLYIFKISLLALFLLILLRKNLENFKQEI